MDLQQILVYLTPFLVFLPGCPPSGDAIWAFLTDLIVGKTPTLGHEHLHYD